MSKASGDLDRHQRKDSPAADASDASSEWKDALTSLERITRMFSPAKRKLIEPIMLEIRNKAVPAAPREEKLRNASQVRDLLPELTRGKNYYPSPAAWEDEVIYFVMLDRFSNGQESGYYDVSDNYVDSGTEGTLFSGRRDRRVRPASEGNVWLGGTLAGAASKLGYLRRLGVTAIWLSPIFRQCNGNPYSYHGYGIQNFLDIDPNFAPHEKPWERRNALRDFVVEAHNQGIRVVLDIVLNHTGDVFEYTRDPSRPWQPRWDGREYPTGNLRDAEGNPTIPFGGVEERHWPGGAVWPAELQSFEAFTRKGEISNWDHFPEYLDGDFCSLKNLHMGWGEVGSFQPSKALVALTECYKFWMAHSDIDGFRIDTVKHIELGATRYFCSAIHEFAQLLGKENFYLIGEITGGRHRAFETLEQTGLDAALGIDEIPSKLESMMAGVCEPNEYFRLFRNSDLFGKESMSWFGSRVVTMFNDHDMVGRRQERLCNQDQYADQQSKERIALLALALNCTTMGIPCIYYGSEQCFDGGGNDHALRMTMFGSEFQPFGATGQHFFDEDFSVYCKLQELLRLREGTTALRRGRQYLREVSVDGGGFGLPTGFGGPVRGIIPWSRIFDCEEILLAMNTDLANSRSARIVVDASIHREGDEFICEYDSCCETLELPDTKKARALTELTPEGIAFVSLTLQPGQFTIWARRGVVHAVPLRERKRPKPQPT